jgi:hypothetical protein
MTRLNVFKLSKQLTGILDQNRQRSNGIGYKRQALSGIGRQNMLLSQFEQGQDFEFDPTPIIEIYREMGVELSEEEIMEDIEIMKAQNVDLEDPEAIADFIKTVHSDLIDKAPKEEPDQGGEPTKEELQLAKKNYRFSSQDDFIMKAQGLSKEQYLRDVITLEDIRVQLASKPTQNTKLNQSINASPLTKKMNSFVKEVSKKYGFAGHNVKLAQETEPQEPQEPKDGKDPKIIIEKHLAEIVSELGQEIDSEVMGELVNELVKIFSKKEEV